MGLATLTYPVVPLNDKALPYFPLVVQVTPPVRLPLWPLPEESVTEVPLLWFKL